MSYTPPLEAEVTAFKTTTPLASGATFTSSAVDVNGYSQVQTEVLASNDGKIDISFCADSGCTDVVRSLSIPYVASNGYQFFAAPAFGNFIEYKFTNNGTVTQTDFYYTTKILTTAISPQLLTTGAFIAPSMVTSLGRNIQVGQDVNGTFVNAPNGGIDDDNSTSTPLSGTGVFNGAFVNTDGYVSTSIFVKSDQDSATKGVQIIHSSDGVTDERVISFSYISADNPQGIVYLIPASTKYFRMKYINGAVAQTGFTASIKFETSPQMLPTLPVNIPISDNTLANTVKAISVGQQPDSTYNNSPHDGLGFSTFDVLVSGATYSSGILDMSSYTQVQTDVTSDGSGTIDIEFIRDAAGTDVVRELSIPYVGGSGFKMFSAPAFTPYVRYNFTSTTTGMTDFYFDTKFTTKSISGQILGMNDFIAGGMVANLGRNVLVGKNDAGNFNNVTTDNQNNLKVDTSNNRVTYDEFPVSEFTAISQLHFPYNINTDLTNVFLLGSGTVTQADNMAIVATSPSGSATESAALESEKTITFRAGEGAVGRFSCLFTDFSPNGATSVQGIGLGDANDGFGYTMVGTSSELNVTYRTSGTSTSFPQSQWNEDVMDGTSSSSNPSGMLLDVTKGNVYQVSYGSGFGCVYFSIESQSTGQMVLVHTLHLSNIRTTPAAYNPTFALRAEVFKDGTADANDYVMKVADMSSFSQGNNKITGAINAFENSKNIGSTNTCLFNLQNKSTVFGGATGNNKVSAILQSISLINDSNGAGTFSIYENATIGGTPSYTDIDANTSVISQDTAGTTVTGGKLLWVGGVGKDNGDSATLFDLGIAMRPGSIYSFVARTLGGANDMSIGLVWVEDF